ncbi:MAG: DmsC/YnfH family molybdoenzyme membrane anchor subunit, partial [Betaproteobacteria bacterium]
MKPALSVIFLTTLSGAAQGLFLALFTAQSYALFGLLPAGQGEPRFYALGAGVALALLGAGLLASFFHLGRPERAWRAAAMWRTSWLSREVIVLPAFMTVVALYGLSHGLQWKFALATLASGGVVDVPVLLGVVGTLLAFALFVCTAMIYACLPFLREWHSPLTVVNYILLGAASGFTLAGALAISAAPQLARFYVGWAIIITLLAF